MLVCAVGCVVMFVSLIYTELAVVADIDVIVLEGYELTKDTDRLYIDDDVNGIIILCSTVEFAGTTQSQSMLLIRPHWSIR